MMNPLSRSFLWLALAASVAACPVASASPASDGTQPYILGPSDVLEVNVLGHPEFDTKNARIGEDGKIKLPYIGSVAASDKTIPELEGEVSAQLDAGGYYSKPIVKVDVLSYGSRTVTVLGEVRTPGLIPVDRPYRLSEIVARVGGTTDAGADYLLFRPLHGAERQLQLQDIAAGDDNQDPWVSPGDKVFVPKAELVYVGGQVNQPGAYPIRPDMTVRMAIARAGGVNMQGTESKVKLTRKGVRLTTVDLNAPVQPGDVLVVGERLF